MTDSEVPQGNQDGLGNARKANDAEQSSSGYAVNPGMAYCLDHKVIVPIGDHADCNKVASIGPSAVSDAEPASLPSNGGGSQDSIDSLEEILNEYHPKSTVKANDDIDDEKAYVMTMIMEHRRYMFKAALEAWHNTQLKASIPEKLQPVCGDPDCIEAKMYNQAIDDITANLEKL